VRDLKKSALDGLPLLEEVSAGEAIDTSQLTAKESFLLEYFRSHPNDVCTKDDIVQAVWPEDQIYERGIRDDSLSQLVRRLRVKIEPDPSTPRYIHTVPGRGYRYTPNTPV
jgi:DNA-binding winged helix-turn-helix (wHTH) protein